MLRWGDHRASPVPGRGLEGYASEMSVQGGDRIGFSLSGPAGCGNLHLARLVQGDPNPDGPGYREERVDWGQPADVDLEGREIDFGSYLEIPPSHSLNPPGAFTLALWFRPTRIQGGWHALAAHWALHELRFSLFYTGGRFLTAGVSRDGRTAEWITAREVAHLDNWQFAALTHDPDRGVLRIYQRLTDTPGAIETRSSYDPMIVVEKSMSRGPLHRSRAALLLGACDDPEGSHRRWAHFNGKIGHPVLLGTALESEGVDELSQAIDPFSLGPVIGNWDLSQEVSGARIVDTSENGNHGRAVNAPGRAVTGPFWGGMPSRLYSDAPEDYNAVHLHDDDLEDAKWPSAFEVQVPSDARTGIYAARVSTDLDELFLPFVVSTRTAAASLGVLIPTFTWQAYGSNRGVYSFTEDGVLDRTLCMYDTHSDGSMVYYWSRLGPTRGWNPTAGFQNWGAHAITANLYLVDWLDSKDIDYDIFADEDLDECGGDLLSQYRCIVLGSHPEYCTENMMDALSAYVRNGGRIAYLGGNGLYWVISRDPERRHLLELRRGGEGDFGPVYQPVPGEAQHSTTGELGGLWSRRGRPPRSIVGVEHASNVWIPSDGSWGFERCPESYEAPYSFVFEGVGESKIGDFGLNLGSAVGCEMDAVHDWTWDERFPCPVVLARSEAGAYTPPRRNPVPPVADIAITASESGGAAFAAGSITWTGSLSHNGYENNVSKITENVIRRFLDRPDGDCVLDT